MNNLTQRVAEAMVRDAKRKAGALHKPTIDELERLLSSESSDKVYINSDGSIYASERPREDDITDMTDLIKDLHAENERLRAELAIAQALHKSTWSMAACRVRGYLIQGDWDVDTCLAIEAEFQERAK